MRAGSFSPDGQQIVFRIESGDTYSLAVIDRDGGNLRRLTTGKGRPSYIDWGAHPYSGSERSCFLAQNVVDVLEGLLEHKNLPVQTQASHPLGSLAAAGACSGD